MKAQKQLPIFFRRGCPVDVDSVAKLARECSALHENGGLSRSGADVVTASLPPKPKVVCSNHTGRATSSTSDHEDPAPRLSRENGASDFLPMEWAEAARERIARSCECDAATGCWLWRRSTMTKGYGQLAFRGRIVAAHRLSYEAHCGAIPEGAFVLHSCDTRACVNPEHLRIGTHAENMAEMKARGRQASGARNAGAKLDADAVDAMRSVSRGNRVSNRELGLAFGVSPTQAHRIRHGEKWGLESRGIRTPHGGMPRTATPARPLKVAFRAGTVLQEVNRWGDPLGPIVPPWASYRGPLAGVTP